MPHGPKPHDDNIWSKTIVIVTLNKPTKTSHNNLTISPFSIGSMHLQIFLEYHGYPKLYQHRPQIAKNNFCVIKGTYPLPLVVTLQRHPAMAPCPLLQSTTSTPPMAPRPLPQSWSSPSPQPSHTTMAPCNGTQQWHHVHSTIAHYNGTLQWHLAMAPRPLNQSWSSPSPQP